MDVDRPESDKCEEKVDFQPERFFLVVSCPVLKIAIAFALVVSLTRAIVPDTRPLQRITLVGNQLFSSHGH